MRKTLLALLLVAGMTPAFGQEKTFNLKISHWVPASHPLQKALEDWGAAVEKASGGTIKYQVFPAQQLGKAFDHYDMARDGIADVTYVNPGYQPGRFPIIGAGELPFLMSSAKGGSMGLDAWYRKYAATEMKDVKFCLAFIHSPSSFHSRTKKIVVPDDIKGMKIRPADATIANFVTLLGGTNVQSSAPEVRDIVERGVADGVTFPWGSLVLFGIDKVTKYHMDAPLYVTTFVLRDEQGQIQRDVRPPEEGDRRQLQHRSRRPRRRALGRVRGCRHRQDEGGAGPGNLQADAGADRAVEEGRRAAGQDLGRQRQESRRRSGRGDDRAEGLAHQVRRLGAITLVTLCRTRRQEPPAAARLAGSGGDMQRASMDRFIDGSNGSRPASSASSRWISFLSVLLRNTLNYSIPDSFDIGRMLLGILIFWGIAATSYRGTHITVDLVWANVGPRYQRLIDVFATLVLLFVVTVQTWTLFDKVRGTYNDHVLTFDMHMPVWPFFAVAWVGDVSAVLLIAIRTYRLIFHPEEMHDPKIKGTE